MTEQKATKKAPTKAKTSESAAPKEKPAQKTRPKPAAQTQKKLTVAGKSIGTRGRTFLGTVISDRMTRTVTVEWERRLYVPKYERYLRRRSRVKAHNPEHINAKKGNKVRVKETRPISKTKHFIVTEIMQ
jgi:small subunit ribosomal protein S17